VLDEFEGRLAAKRWGLYRVRRIYTAKGAALRCVERLQEGSRAEMEALFASKVAGDTSLEVDTIHGIRYAMFQRRVKDVYPTAEGFFVIAPLFVETKLRGPIEKFDERWSNVVGGFGLNASHDPAQESLALADAA
jgi:hypothetical protein